jgi:mono/diheme cytochrome c family protein
MRTLARRGDHSSVPSPGRPIRPRFPTRIWFSLSVALIGCAGPPLLSRAIVPRDQTAYASALAADPVSPKRAFLKWRAEERSIAFEDAASRDSALSPTRNPFDANRDREAVSLGAVVYAAHCQRCHGENVDGRGPDVLPQAPCKDFHSFDKRFAVTLHRGAPKAWFAKIRDGHGPVAPYPEGPSSAMPPFRDKLSNEQIWLAITYLQSLDLYVPPPAGR